MLYCDGNKTPSSAISSVQQVKILVIVGIIILIIQWSNTVAYFYMHYIPYSLDICHGIKGRANFIGLVRYHFLSSGLMSASVRFHNRVLLFAC